MENVDLDATTINKRLDELLSAFNTHTSQGEFITGLTASERAGLSLTNEIASLLALKLEADGYITWAPTKSQGVTSIKKEYYFLNVDGITFEAAGGYQAKARKRARMAFRDDFEKWAIIAGGVVAILYFLRAVVLWSISVCSS